MASNSEGTCGVLSLPGGGGAQNGTRQTFSPQLRIPTGNVKVPIAPPPRRNEFQPEVNVVCSAENGHESLGLSWASAYPSLDHKTSLSPVRDRDRASERDVFLLRDQTVEKASWTSGRLWEARAGELCVPTGSPTQQPTRWRPL